MATLDPIQSRALDTGNNSSEAIAGTVGSWDATVTAGSTLIAIIQNASSNARTFGVEDNVTASAWTARPQVAQAAGNYNSQVFYYENHPGGTVTVTVTSNANLVKRVVLIEVPPCTFEQDSSLVDVSAAVDASLGYPCSGTSDLIDTGSPVFVVSGVVLTASGGLDGGSNGFTNLYTNNVNFLSQYKASDSALTDERGWVAESGNNRNFGGFIASFAAVASGATGTLAATTRRNTLAASGVVDNITGTLAAATRRNTLDAAGAVDGVFGAFAAATRRDTLDAAGDVDPVTGTLAAVTRRNAMAFDGEVTGNVAGTFAAATRRNTASLEGEVDIITGTFAATTRRNTLTASGVSGELEPGGGTVRMRHYLEKQVGGNGQRG